MCLAQSMLRTRIIQCDLPLDMSWMIVMDEILRILDTSGVKVGVYDLPLIMSEIIDRSERCACGLQDAGSL